MDEELTVYDEKRNNAIDKAFMWRELWVELKKLLKGLCKGNIRI
jgi:hypothetical protein